MIQLLCAIDGYKVLKASAVSPVLKELKLDEADDCGVGEDQLLQRWWVLKPAVLQVGYKQLLPRTGVVGGAEDFEAFCGSVTVKSIVGVSESHTPNRSAATKAHGETLVFNSCTLCQPVVARIRPSVRIRPDINPAVNVKRKDVAGKEDSAPTVAGTSFMSLWAFVAFAAHYLLQARGS